MGKISQAYKPYWPAFTTFFGAVVLGIGMLFIQSPDPAFAWMRSIGAVVAALGALWSGHRQVLSSAENRARDEKIVQLAEQVHGYATGSDSFCFGFPQFNLERTAFSWVFVHQGIYPLSEVSVRIVDLSKAPNTPGWIGQECELGTLFPGRAHSVATTPVQLASPSHGFNLFFLARNGSWTQEIRWVSVPDAQITANRVVRDGQPMNKPLFLEISPRFASPLPDNDAWNNDPPYEAKPANAPVTS